MASKLKTYQTSRAFYDLAIAAPSMKAALEGWGGGSNLFHQGVAKKTDDPDVVAATLAKPGVVLRRPRGPTGVSPSTPTYPPSWGPGKPKADAEIAIRDQRSERRPGSARRPPGNQHRILKRSRSGAKKPPWRKSANGATKLFERADRSRQGQA